MPEPTPALRTLVTAWLGLVVIAGLVWLLANYPGNHPTQGALPDNCKTINQRNSYAEHNNGDTNHFPPLVIQPEPTMRHGDSNGEEENSSNERRLAEYTCQLAVYTSQLAIFTELLVAVTVIVALVGLWQGIHLSRHAGHLEGAVAAAREANKLARDQFMINIRPWIAVLDIKPTGPIFLDQNALVINAVIKIQNVGHSPAQHVKPVYRGYPRIAPYVLGNRVRAELDDIFTRARYRTDLLAEVIFPGQERDVTVNVVIARDLLPMEPGDKSTILIPVIVGCFDYCFMTDPEEHHQTGFAYYIGSGVPGMPQTTSPGQIHISDLAALGTLIEHQFVRIERFYGGWVAN